ncbi:3-oxoacyl-ACP synthase III family protein [Polynucleobacter bastaniensis]|uniref:3-oxoacyl-ACP synthase III family protein n=1 Tax=Polynucleobacter bastaniensis TaxID=2081039 RepID=UPI001C0AC2D5|nr:ketoacyl-ACP synthase III [Polynucleobacter bastaniensis]MBU3598258.1 ketoacyl-ACP synthase III [Polynucleobacter bastaniensis]
MTISFNSETYGVSVSGVGKYLPDEIILNDRIERETGLSPGYIEEKTGILERRRAGKNESASEMGVKAAKAALTMAGILPDQLGLIVTCTFTGDYVFPAVSCRIQEELGAINAGAFDVMANCTGFQVGLGIVSDRMRLDSTIKYALVIGLALQSRFIDWSDPNSAIYFGDGAGAAILKQVPAGYGFLHNEILSNGKVFDAVRMRGGGSSFPFREKDANNSLQNYELNGLEVWKQVIKYQPIVINRSLGKIGKTVKDVNFFIFHQANLRLIEYMMARMNLPLSKTLINIDKYGNTADASLAIALCDSVCNDNLKRGDLVVISGVGAGFIFGSTVLKWY